MNKRQIERFKDDVYNTVFQMLDAEPELDGLECGAIAARTAAEFERVLRIQLGLEQIPVQQ